MGIPFGNSKSSKGGQDLVSNPTQPGGGAGQDFIENPKSTAGGTGEDMTKGNAAEQKTGENPTLHKDSVPSGGKVLKADPPAGYPAGTVGTTPGSGSRKPFKL